MFLKNSLTVYAETIAIKGIQRFKKTQASGEMNAVL